jgi:tellurite resistance protein
MTGPAVARAEILQRSRAGGASHTHISVGVRIPDWRCPATLTALPYEPSTISLTAGPRKDIPVFLRAATATSPEPQQGDPSRLPPKVSVDAQLRRPRTRPLVLALYAIPLGLAGLASAWVAANSLLGAPSWPDEVLYGLSAAFWLVFTAIYLWQGIWDGGSFIRDLKHPGTGPFTAFIPLVGILLAAHYSQYALTLGRWICVFFILGLLVTASRLFAHWVTAGMTMQTIHPGFFVPMIAGAFVASIGFSSIHAHQEALAAFGIGLFFWPVLAAVVMTRLMTAAPLPALIVPSLSAFLATAATANVAWIVSHPGPMGEAQHLLTGVLVVMVVIQLVLLDEYRKLPFNFSFWVFTFPVAVTANYAVRWSAAAGIAHWETWAWVALGLASAFVAAIAGWTVLLRAGRLRAPASIPAV